METKFHAKFLYTQNNHDVIMVGFADDEFETKDYILLQKSGVDSDQDQKLGLDKVCLVYRDQSCSTYGGIQKFILQKNCATILLNQDTANILGTKEKIEIEFSSRNPELFEINQCLELLFKKERGVFESDI